MRTVLATFDILLSGHAWVLWSLVKKNRADFKIHKERTLLNSGKNADYKKI